MTQSYSRAELLVAVIARLLEGCRHVTVGASSPIPGAAALLRQELTQGAMRVTILGSNRYNAYTNGGVETFDMAAQGRIDAFFLGGGQIDGQGNINLVGTGHIPRKRGALARLLRFGLSVLPGAEGDPVPRRAYAAGAGAEGGLHQRAGRERPGVYRPGGPYGLLTGLAWFSFDKQKQRFRLESVHPGTASRKSATRPASHSIAPSRCRSRPHPSPTSWR